MPILNWIKDQDLLNTVKSLLDVADVAKSKSVNSFGDNVVDPFSAIFGMSGFNMTYDEWYKSEEARQAQKTLQNFIGGFHQTILGSFNGWANQKVGNVIDLVNVNSKIVAEVKNKYNTISGGSLADLYHGLENFVMPKSSKYKGYVAYHVVIIPKSPARFDIEFTPSAKGTGQKCPSNKLIRQIDGASFYTLVTGDQNALENLFDAIPNVIKQVNSASNLDVARLKLLFKAAYG